MEVVLGSWSHIGRHVYPNLRHEILLGYMLCFPNFLTCQIKFQKRVIRIYRWNPPTQTY